MKITGIRLEQVRGEISIPPGSGIERNVGALYLYPEYAPKGWREFTPQEIAKPRPITGIYVHIDTDEGITGTFGAIELDQAFEIDVHLRPFLIGADPLAVERIWDVLSRHDRHARRGLLMMAQSAVDIALWDIRGKAANMPVYRLLGGPTRDEIPAYASTVGACLDPEAVHKLARQLVEEGFSAQKWFFGYGPSDGREGFEKNMELVLTAREAVGDKVDLMFDAWMGWDVPYAIEMAQRMEPFHPRWLEEPVAVDRITAFNQIRQRCNIPISSGEHEYTRWGFKVLLDSNGVDVIQADPDWAGGLTEMTKIVALSSAYGKPVIPHGHSVIPALHLIASQSPEVCPILEFLYLTGPGKQWFHKERFVPVNGKIKLPQGPGLSLELDPTHVLSSTLLSWH